MIDFELSQLQTFMFINAYRLAYNSEEATIRHRLKNIDTIDKKIAYYAHKEPITKRRKYLVER